MKQCYKCRYWQGDRENTEKLIASSINSMDLFDGWPNSGGCGIAYEWAEIEVNGNATTSLEVPANFGCVYFTPFGT